MSLENEIKELRASIITLTEVISNMQNAAPAVEAEKVAKPEKKKKAVETVTEQDSSTKSKTVDVTVKTHNDLKSVCLKVARAVDGNKVKVKSVLADYDAVKASDVPADKIAEVIEKIEAI